MIWLKTWDNKSFAKFNASFYNYKDNLKMLGKKSDMTKDMVQ